MQTAKSLAGSEDLSVVLSLSFSHTPLRVRVKICEVSKEAKALLLDKEGLGAMPST